MQGLTCFCIEVIPNTFKAVTSSIFEVTQFTCLFKSVNRSNVDLRSLKPIKICFSFCFTTLVQQHKFLKDDINSMVLLSSLIFFSLNVEERSHWKKLSAIKTYFLKGFIRFLFLDIFPLD